MIASLVELEFADPLVLAASNVGLYVFAVVLIAPLQQYWSKHC